MIDQTATGGPWWTDGVRICGGEKDTLVATVAYCRTSELANARRIVACVNACAHISTESLESGVQLIELMAELIHVKQML